MKKIWFDRTNRLLLPSTLLTLAGAIMNRHFFVRPPRAAVVCYADLEAAERERLPFISVIVPARNEERNLPRLLPSLLAQDYPADRYEVLVVDDNSTDSTPAILREYASDPRIRLVAGEPLPEGWAGKTHAAWQGAEAAQTHKGGWLLFTDADTVFAPAALTSAWHDADLHQTDLYSIAPFLQLGSFWEKVIMPIVVTGIYAVYAPAKVNNPHSKTAIANGQFVFVKRAVYEAVGGFAAIKAEIVEDLRFGQLVKHRGYRLWLSEGRSLMQVRMYTNFAEVWEGWSKNVAFGVAETPVQAVLGAAAMGATTIVGPALPLYLSNRLLHNLRRGKAQPADALALGQSLLQVGTAASYLRQTQRSFDLPRRYLLTVPLGAIMFLAIIINSLYRLLSGKGVTWKGRSYQRSLRK